MRLYLIRHTKPHILFRIRQDKRTALYWVIMQRVVAISYRRFGTTYRPIFGVKEGTDRWSQNVGENPEECISNLLRGGSRKSRTAETHFNIILPHT